MIRQFRDRTEAGRFLATELLAYANRTDVIVLALPRGGVPVAAEVAKTLHAPLDVLTVRKLGVPGHEELAMGAIATGGTRILNDSIVEYLGISAEAIDRVATRELYELERRERAYRNGRKPLDLYGRTVILIDDGLATGATMQAAVNAVRKLEPKQVIVAAPVAARDTCAEFRSEADVLCVCVTTPEPFGGVGLWYRDFSPPTDEEVCSLLAEAVRGHTRHAA